MFEQFIGSGGDAQSAYVLYTMRWWISQIGAVAWLLIAWRLLKLARTDPSEIVFLGTGLLLYAFSNLIEITSAGPVIDIISTTPIVKIIPHQPVVDILRCGLVTISVILAGVVWDRMKEFEKAQREAQAAWEEIEKDIAELKINHGSNRA